MLRVLTCVTHDHDWRLVLLSAGICLIGCFSAVVLLAQATEKRDKSSSRWILGAAGVFGSSVWSLHFVAMLAFLPSQHIAYALGLTILSIAVAIAGSLVALLLWQRSRQHGVGLALAGALLGLSIAGMHYLGVGAMQGFGFVQLDPAYLAGSIGVSVGFAILALVRAADLASLVRRLEVTVWLGLAICGMHFIGMAGLTVAPAAVQDGGSFVLGSTHLGLAVGLVSVALLSAFLVALLQQQHLSQRRRDELGRMRLLANLAHEVLFIHRDGHVLEVNQAGARLFGRGVDEIIGTPILDLFSEADTPALLRRARCRSEELTPEEFAIRTSGGTLVPVELSCRTIAYAGSPATAVALRDLSDRRRDEARIRHFALHDALTDLPNRYLLDERLKLALDAAAQDGARLAVIHLDLDRFKPVNDLYGHAVGDALLVQAAKRMQAELRPSDTLARLGADEFVIVLAQARTPAQVSRLATRLIAGLGRAYRIEEQRIEIAASAGIALYPDDGRTSEALLRAADTARDRAKDEGRARFCFFEAELDEALHDRRQLEHELSRAIDKDELRLFYQPIVNARSGEIETFEALIRWQHPERGFISPAEFIPLAEQSGQIARIGQWVIETACATAVSWPKAWRVSVNVSPSQFRQSDVAAMVAAALARNGLTPNRLVVEITEGVFIENGAEAVAVLTNLREQGIRLALDDFGTGYSSLSYLQRFRFDKIKIDQSFVRTLGQNSDTLTIVRAIVNLGHNLGLQVTVEGVETIEQLRILQGLGCDQMQGYLFSRPMPLTVIADVHQDQIQNLFVATNLKAIA